MKHSLFHAVRRVTACVFCLMLTLSVLCPVIFAAESTSDNQSDSDQKVVRVGYVNVATYEEGGEGEYKRGAGYEYLQKISYMTGWKYEYVYGSFQECYQKLVNGEIDLFGNISYTPEREGLFYYSNYPQGKDVYFIYTTRENTELTSGEIQNLNKKTIGVTKESYQETLLKTWLNDNHIEAKTRAYSGYDAMMEALDSGKVDAIAAPDLSTTYNYLPVTNIGFSDYYFAVSKKRADLLPELNQALYDIQNSEFDYNNLLASRYQTRMLNNTWLNDRESKWLSEHNQVIRFGYLKENLPYSDEDNSGTLVGILGTLMDTLELEFGASIETHAYDTVLELADALDNHEVDAIGPVFSDFWLAEQFDYVLTNHVLSTTPVVLFKTNSDADIRMDKIAVTPKSFFSRESVKILFPDADILPYDNIEECLNAVAEGKATSTVITASQLNVLRPYPAMDQLGAVELAKKVEIGIFTTKENRALATIFNKGISLSSDILSGAVMAEHSYKERVVSFQDFIKRYFVLFIIVASVIVAGLSILIYFLFRSHKRVSSTNKQLAENQKTLAETSNILSTMNIGIWKFYLYDNDRPARLCADEKMKEILGVQGESLSEEELYNIWYTHIKPESLPSVQENVEELKSGKKSENTYIWTHPKTGMDMYVRCGGVGEKIEGEGYLLQGYHYIVTKEILGEQQKKLELEKALHEAKTANLAKTTFLNNMSHDIRTPMNAIIGFSNIALKQQPNEKVQDCLKKIDQSAEHLLMLINDVLDISRIESGKTQYNPIPVNISTVTDAVLTIIQGFLTNRELTFRVYREKPENPYVIADAVRIREVLVNILSNAVKFTHDGGEIVFRSDYHPGDTPDRLVVRYIISDTGVGMSKEYLTHIFDEFSQEESGARTQYKGTGLGMAITKRYVELMGGTITVDSTKGVGSTFTVEIPLQQTVEAAVKKQELPVSKTDLSNVRALMAEDNDLNAEIATIQLEDLGMHITRVSNGKEAVEAFRNNPPHTFDVILMDIMMPELNGYEATKAIRATPNRPDAKVIPIIAMTANAFAEDVQATIDSGMNAHIAKPIVIDEVVRTIARNLNP